ncbi:FliO/MopB family protein [Sphingomonas solaris]|uniref:FliO/MopB family protein n=1 Tax=Alterirhizorhabdus solaris TaxID=2529389 RepID=A0A558R1B6_9SPHN|nr:flagellar biosynthetic protein FliO [Sphingomonas solaris]TVV73175.1 FliO/MopB family protein [Sphingomonas solaris]
MTAYILRLLILLPLVAGMAFGALWLWRRVQPGLSLGQRDRAIKVVDAIPMGATGRLAVVEFGGKRLLLAVSRGRIEKLAETPLAGAPAVSVVGDGDEGVVDG